MKRPEARHCCWKTGTTYSGPMWCGNKAKAIIRDPWLKLTKLQLEVCGVHLRKAERQGIEVIERYEEEK